MFASFPSLLAGPLSGGFFVRQLRPSRVEEDLEALLTRMRQRSYPETTPVLASFWLKTVFASGYGFRRWKQLSRLLKRALAEPLLDDLSRQALIDIQTWIQETIILTGQPPQSLPPRFEGHLQAEILPELWLLNRHTLQLRGPVHQDRSQDVAVFTTTEESATKAGHSFQDPAIGPETGPIDR